MILAAIFVVAITVFHHANAQGSCGIQADAYPPYLTPKMRIIGGTEARPHSWPWLTFLSVNMGGNSISLCGASLLQVRGNTEQSDIVLTAAHCVTTSESQGTDPVIYEPVSRVQVLAGAHDRNAIDEDGTERRTADTIKILADFRFTSATGAVNDLAIVKLNSPIKFTDTIRPVCLPAQGDDIPAGKTCVAAGWGRTDGDGANGLPSRLQQLVLPVQTANTCANGWGATYKEDLMICAGSLSGTSATCQGDSGGQLVCQQSDGSWTLYGATSFGVSGCLMADRPPIFARVSSYVDWITERANALTSL